MCGCVQQTGTANKKGHEASYRHAQLPGPGSQQYSGLCQASVEVHQGGTREDGVQQTGRGTRARDVVGCQRRPRSVDAGAGATCREPGVCGYGEDDLQPAAPTACPKA